MSKDDLVPHDIALATMSRGMYARLLTDEDKSKIAAIRSTNDLVAYLKHTKGWETAAKVLPPDASTELFSLEIERQLYREYERLYRFAQKTAKEFLVFLALRAKCYAILAALRRLASPNSRAYTDPLPPFFHRLPGYNVDRIAKAKNYQELLAAIGGGIYSEALADVPVDPATGLPHYADAAITLEKRYYFELSDFLQHKYAGPDREGLLESVGFHADMLNISYLLRLKRFGAPPESAMGLLLPIPGSLSAETMHDILFADDDEMVRLVSRALRIKHIGEIDTLDEKFLHTAEAAYFRKVIHGPPTLSVAYAFIILKQAECNMLRHIYVALHYGFDIETYVEEG